MILDLLFPKFCIGCKEWGKYLCEQCKKDIEFFNLYICPICGIQTHPQLIHARCLNKTYIDGVVSSMKYNKVAKKIVKAIKYQLIYDIYNELFDVVLNKESRLFTQFYNSYPHCYLQPIPLHTTRYKIRGFNQAYELAKLFSKKFQYPCTDSLVRVKNTRPQAQIHHKKDRQENIQGAFQVMKGCVVKDKIIILVDDVYTSGSTCLEGAKTLKQQGALKVFVWSLAKD